MTLLEIALIGLSLALDAGAAAVGAGSSGRMTIRRGILVAVLFGAAHALMPLAGFLLGYVVKDYIAAYGAFVTAGLLIAIGAKMLYDAWKNEEEDPLPMKLSLLFSLAFLMSLDAFAIGISFSLIEVNVLVASLIIGGITTAVSLLGVAVGLKTRHLAGRKIEIVGALILIALGIKALLF